VVPAPVVPSDSVQLIEGRGFMNVARSSTLAFSVYRAATAARARPRGWVDGPSQNSLFGYVFLYAPWPGRSASATGHGGASAGVARRDPRQHDLRPARPRGRD